MRTTISRSSQLTDSDTPRSAGPLRPLRPTAPPCLRWTRNGDDARSERSWEEDEEEREGEDCGGREKLTRFLGRSRRLSGADREDRRNEDGDDADETDRTLSSRSCSPSSLSPFPRRLEPDSSPSSSSFQRLSLSTSSTSFIFSLPFLSSRCSCLLLIGRRGRGLVKIRSSSFPNSSSPRLLPLPPTLPPRPLLETRSLLRSRSASVPQHDTTRHSLHEPPCHAMRAAAVIGGLPCGMMWPPRVKLGWSGCCTRASICGRGSCRALTALGAPPASGCASWATLMSTHLGEAQVIYLVR